jgi:hypothetical protein
MTSRARKCCASRGKGGVRLTLDRNQSWSPQKRLMWHSGTRKTFAIEGEASKLWDESGGCAKRADRCVRQLVSCTAVEGGVARAGRRRVEFRTRER